MRFIRLSPSWLAAESVTRSAAIGACCIAAFGLALSVRRGNAISPRPPATLQKDTEWRAYGSDLSNSKYSPLEQINRSTVSRLKVAWRWRSPDDEVLKSHPKLQTWIFESTPLMIDGVLYRLSTLKPAAPFGVTTQGVTKRAIQRITALCIEESPIGATGRRAGCLSALGMPD
jgi:glucose dehydrogenase